MYSCVRFVLYTSRETSVEWLCTRWNAVPALSLRVYRKDPPKIEVENKNSTDLLVGSVLFKVGI